MNQAAKGTLGGKCNRTACPNKGANCWSSVEQAYYCRHCAVEINKWIPRNVPKITIPLDPTN